MTAPQAGLSFPPIGLVRRRRIEVASGQTTDKTLRIGLRADLVQTNPLSLVPKNTILFQFAQPLLNVGLLFFRKGGKVGIVLEINQLADLLLERLAQPQGYRVSFAGPIVGDFVRKGPSNDLVTTKQPACGECHHKHNDSHRADGCPK